MAIDPIKIPQNVYIEDRIVGPLTLKQIITVAIGCGFSYALYSLLLKSYGDIPLPVAVLVWVPGVLSFAFAFLKINDLSLFRILLLMVERINKPAVRTWTPRRGLSVNIRTFSGPQAEAQASTAGNKKNTSEIDELSSILDLSMPALVPSQAGGEKAALSPLQEEVSEQESAPPRPVDRSRVNAESHTEATGTPRGAVSIFRDISPR